MTPKKTLPQSSVSLLFMEFLLHGGVPGHRPLCAARAHAPDELFPGAPFSPWPQQEAPGTTLCGSTWDHAQGEAGRQMVSVHCAVFMLIADIFNVLCYSIHLCERSVL